MAGLFTVISRYRRMCMAILLLPVLLLGGLRGFEAAGYHPPQPEDVSLATGVFATDPTFATSRLSDPGKVRIGLQYGSSAKEEFICTEPGGMQVGVAEKQTNRFDPVITLPEGKYSVTPTYGYWVCVDGYRAPNGTTYTPEKHMDRLLAMVCEAGLTAYAGYADGFCCCLPLLSSFDDADQVYEQLAAYDSGFDLRILRCSSAATKLFRIDEVPEFFFDGHSDVAMALTPLPTDSDPEGHTEIGSYRYRGDIELRRDASDHIEVINLVPLEHYVECINAGEIYSSWPIEIHKVFAVTARTYTIANLGYHDKKYQFDLCCSTCCQHYVGDMDISSKIRQGVEETAGEILLYDGKIAKVNYAAIAGGVTASAADVWGGWAYPYLIAQPTPWERFGRHCKPYSAANYTYKGKFTRSYTGKELYDRLKSSYPALKGEISRVEILSFAEESSYVTGVRLTDCYGNYAEITTSDRIRTALGLDSANFVVGKAGERVTRVYYELEQFPSVIYGEGLSEDAPLPDLFSGKAVRKTMEILLEGPEGSFVFDGAGWGHGVGLSQYGAWDLCSLGYDYQTVLRYYFPETVIDTLEKQPEAFVGDLNGDGILSIGDVSLLLLWMGDAQQLPVDSLALADLNGDGILSIGDVSLLLLRLGSGR